VQPGIGSDALRNPGVDRRDDVLLHAVPAFEERSLVRWRIGSKLRYRDTLGVGGVFRALRTIPVLPEIADWSPAV